MTLDEYQRQAAQTDVFAHDGVTPRITDAAYVDKLLGLVGESGEVAEKYKKILRNNDGAISEHDRIEITKELGDVMWHIALIARYLDTSLEDVAQANLAKIKDRTARDTIRSSGDER